MPWGVVRDNTNYVPPPVVISNRDFDSSAQGPHSVFDDRGSTTFDTSKYNPNGIGWTERIDKKGDPHRNSDGTLVPTPHKHKRGVKDVTPL